VIKNIIIAVLLLALAGGSYFCWSEITTVRAEAVRLQEESDLFRGRWIRAVKNYHEDSDRFWKRIESLKSICDRHKINFSFNAQESSYSETEPKMSDAELEAYKRRIGVIKDTVPRNVTP
jgi:hypothetical protein